MNKFLGAVKWLSGGMLNSVEFLEESSVILKDYEGDLKIINVYGPLYSGLVFATEDTSTEDAQAYFDEHLKRAGFNI